VFLTIDHSCYHLVGVVVTYEHRSGQWQSISPRRNCWKTL